MSSEVVIERLEEYSDETAAAIGRLLPFLSKNATGKPVNESLLREIIDSPDREQLVARLEGRLVGSAVLNRIVGNTRTKAWLEDFVVYPEVQGHGVGYKLWQEMLNWCAEHGVDYLEFTSGNDREEAVEFYKRRGATIRDTNMFRLKIE
jgi:GNAT superfamily N-acetyltransferase